MTRLPFTNIMFEELSLDSFSFPGASQKSAEQKALSFLSYALRFPFNGKKLGPLSLAEGQGDPRLAGSALEIILSHRSAAQW